MGHKEYLADLFSNISDMPSEGWEGCWQWNAAKLDHPDPMKARYGIAHDWKGKLGKAHRIVYELIVGPLPTGYMLRNTCFSKSCVNPRHWTPMPAKECRREVATIARLHRVQRAAERRLAAPPKRRRRKVSPWDF